MALVISKDYGKDENFVDKFLIKNKVGILKWREIYIYIGIDIGVWILKLFC